MLRNVTRPFRTLVCVGLACACALGDESPVDLILTGGMVVTADDRDTIHEAMAIRGDRIVMVGSDRDALALRGEGTRVVELHGRSVLPGLIDSHTHPLFAAMTEFDHPIPSMSRISDVLEYVRERSKILKPGEWIILQQIFITRLEEQRYPTKRELDDAAPHHPVFFRTGPDCSLNTAALRVLGLDGEKDLPPGTKIESDERGVPTGIVRGWERILGAIPLGPERTPSEVDQYERLQALFLDYASVGITSIADRAAQPGSLTLYAKMLERGELPVRIAASWHVVGDGSPEDIAERIGQAAAHPLHGGGPMLRIVGVKMFLDGGMLTGSAYMNEPWGVSEKYNITDPAYQGLRFLDDPTLLAAARTAVEHHLQFTAHSVGDAAVAALVDVYEQLADEPGFAATRPCVTHANFISAQTIAKMAQLGVVADIQPPWLTLDGRTLLSHFGDARMEHFQPLRACFDAGVVIGGGSDHMQKIGGLRSVNYYNPFHAIHAAITRRSRGLDEPINPEQAITRLEAIRFYTINNAYLMFLDDVTGSLQPGKLADFVILDRDILSCPVDAIKDIEVDATYLSGSPTFRRSG